ncbi:hypothetical protein B0O80DRAFT_449416, partial [Mortierella sp. GBAus27b]
MLSYRIVSKLIPPPASSSNSGSPLPASSSNNDSHVVPLPDDAWQPSFQNAQVEPNWREFTKRLEDATGDQALQNPRENDHLVLKTLLGYGVVVDTCQKSNHIGRVIVDCFLQPASPFELEITMGDDDPVRVPVNTRLLFQYLAETLNIVVFLFSSQAAPRVYYPTPSADGATKVCGLYHRVDSYNATAEYLVLSFANRCTRRTIQRKLVKDTTSGTFSSSSDFPATSSSLASTSSGPSPSSSTPPSHTARGTAATYRTVPRERVQKRKPLDDEDKKLMKEALVHGCLERLEKDLAKAVANFSKDTKDISGCEENMHATMTTHKRKLLEFARCPSGVMTSAVDWYKKTQMGNTRSPVRIQYDIKAAVSHDIMGVWRKVVEDKFDTIWAECILTKNSIKGTGGGKDSTGSAEDDDTSGENHRVCTSSLKAILRPELSNHYDKIVDLLDRRQEAASELADDMYTLVHKGTLIVARGELYSTGTQQFDLAGLLPPCFAVPDDSRMVDVAPLPPGLQRTIEGGTGVVYKDIKTLFKQEHLSKLYTHFSRPSPDHQDTSSSSSPSASAIVSRPEMMTLISDKDRNDHPSWAALSVALASNSICPRMSGRDGFTKTSEAHLRQCSTAIQNLWEGDVYKKSLDYLLRFLLRTYLAPKRDATNRERAARFVARKKETNDRKQEAKQHTLSASHWRHAMRQLTDRLTDVAQKKRKETTPEIH